MEMTARALDVISVPAFIINQQHKVVAWNRACELLTGILAKDVIGTDRQWAPFYRGPRPCLADLVVDNATDRLAAHYRQHGKAQFAFDAYKAEGWFENLNGRRRYLVFEARPLIADSAVTGALEMLQDITDHKTAGDQLRLAVNVFENTTDGIMITDANNRVVSVNKAFHRITGYGDEIIGENPKMLGSDRHSNEFFRKIWVTLRQTGKWQGEIWNRRKTGEEYLIRMSVSVVADRGRVMNYVAMFSDITRDKEVEDRINYLAHHDFLTGLPNRVLLEDRISQLVAHAARGGESFAVAFIDLDKFKLVNDALGHDIGDKLLKEAASRLLASVRATDTVSRQGGDEFAVLLTGVQNPHDLAQLATKMLRALGEPYTLKGRNLVVTPSIGLSVFPSDGQSAAELIKSADTAMYHAKDNGRNNFQFFTQNLNGEALESLMLESGLKAAIPTELFIEYQPQLCLQSRSVGGAEALVRWQHPTLGLISPAKFIPLAEDSGLIKEIGLWVLQQSCQMIRQTGLKIAVNLSPVQLLDSALVAQIEEAVDGMDAGLLTLEITESALIRDFSKAKSILERMKQIGVVLALDDFGTGYSSLSYLRKLPLDYIKIDQSFIQDEDSRSIVLAIIGLADKLGMYTIAEGVETPEQMAFLERNGCSFIQGYYFSRPLKDGGFVQFLETCPKAKEAPRPPAAKSEPLLTWSFTFSTGIAEIDEQHRKIIEMINRLHANGGDSGAVQTTLDELGAYTQYHFGSETRLMRRFQLPDSDSHLQEHHDFVVRLGELCRQLKTEVSAGLAKDVTLFLRDWLTNHILMTDKKLGDELRKAGFSG